MDANLRDDAVVLMRWSYMGKADRPVLSVAAFRFGETKFPRGAHDPDFLAALEVVCRKPVCVRRSYNVCMLCRKTSVEYAEFYHYRANGIVFCVSNADVLVKATSGIAYCAPIQVFHYVRDHHYLPPQDFVDAVKHGVDEDMSWYAEE